MAITKSRLIEAITEQNGFTRIKSTETVKPILELIQPTLASGEDARINGSGKYFPKENNAKYHLANFSDTISQKNNRVLFLRI